MTKFYSKMARIYHEMYQSIFNYKEQFNFYNGLLRRYRCKKILELGCGSGNLAPYFMTNGYSYLGLDLSADMINIARETQPNAKFLQGDMRNLRLKEKFDAILVTGRSFTYMTTNSDVMKALNSINSALRVNGILIFDNFNAESIFTNFEKRLVQTATFKNRRYKRVINKSLNLKTGWTWNLSETYYIKENGKSRIMKDKDLLRAFTIDEINLFLRLCKFKILKNIKQNFSFTTIARKI